MITIYSFFGIESWKKEFAVCKSFCIHYCLIMHSLEAHQSRKFFRDTKMHFLCTSRTPPQRNDFYEKTESYKKYTCWSVLCLLAWQLTLNISDFGNLKSRKVYPLSALWMQAFYHPMKSFHLSVIRRLFYPFKDFTGLLHMQKFYKNF